MTSAALRSATSLPIRSFSAELTKGLGIVPARFIQEMIVGIHRARSLHLTDIAKSLLEDVELRATHKRLSRNLSRPGMADTVANALLQRAARDVTEGMILVISFYDLPKQFATRMEFARGGADTSTNDGYYVCDISAVDPASPHYYIPLLSRLWSRHAPDYESDAAEVLAAVDQVREATAGRGMFVCLSIPEDISHALAHHPNLKILLDVTSHDTAFVVNGQRKVLSEFVSDVELPYGKLMFKLLPADYAREFFGRNDDLEVSVFTQFGGFQVQPVPSKNSPTKNSEQPTTLIMTRTTPGGHQQPLRPVAPRANLFYLARGTEATTPDQLWSLLQDQWLAGHMALMCVQHKSRFNQSDFRVLTYDRLQLLNALLQAVTHYEANIEKSYTAETHPITTAPHSGRHARDFMVPADIAQP